MISWLNTNSGAVIAMLTVVLIVVTYLYVRYTRDMVNQMEKQRLDSCRPVVTAVWRENEQTHLGELYFENCGLGPALNFEAKIRKYPCAGKLEMNDSLTNRFALASLSSGKEEPIGYHDGPEDNAAYVIRLEYDDVYGRAFETVQEYFCEVEGSKPIMRMIPARTDAEPPGILLKGAVEPQV